MRWALVVAVAVSVTACGGGGGGSASSTPSSPPTSGSYSWLLKAQGPTSALAYGLSLVHPSQPGVEYRVEFGSSVVTDARLVVSGTLNPSALKASALSPYALLYIIGGDVRRVPMVANGVAPSSQIQRAQSTTACSFVIDGNDYATPENSRFIVSTAGADGQCGTADDGRAEVDLGGSNGLSLTPVSGDPPLGMFRDASTLVPRGWIYPTSVYFWNSSPGNSVILRSSSQQRYADAVATSYSAALMDDGTKLSVLAFPAGANPVETLLDPSITGGGGWTNVGYDAKNFYAYRNSGNSTWTVLKISLTQPAATVLASGVGQVGVISMGSGLLYANIVGSSGNSLLAISKTAGVPIDTLESTPSSTLTTVQTGADGIHELWRVVNVGTSAVNYTVSMIDELGNTLYSTNAGGFPMAVADPSALDFTVSENRTLFLFASGFGSRAFGDASLVGYDTVARAATTLGTLPGSAAFGTATVFATVMGGPASFMTGYAAVSSGGVVQSSGSLVFSFSAGVAGSLQDTTSAQ
jgi:hypothetical protein